MPMFDAELTVIRAEEPLVGVEMRKARIRSLNLGPVYARRSDCRDESPYFEGPPRTIAL